MWKHCKNTQHTYIHIHVFRDFPGNRSSIHRWGEGYYSRVEEDQEGLTGFWKEQMWSGFSGFFSKESRFNPESWFSQHKVLSWMHHSWTLIITQQLYLNQLHPAGFWGGGLAYSAFSHSNKRDIKWEGLSAIADLKTQVCVSWSCWLVSSMLISELLYTSTPCLDQQGEPSSAGNEQGVERLLTRCWVQRSPGRQNLTGGQFMIESIEHLQDVGFSCATTGQMWAPKEARHRLSDLWDRKSLRCYSLFEINRPWWGSLHDSKVLSKIFPRDLRETFCQVEKTFLIPTVWRVPVNASALELISTFSVINLQQ